MAKPINAIIAESTARQYYDNNNKQDFAQLRTKSLVVDDNDGHPRLSTYSDGSDD